MTKHRTHQWLAKSVVALGLLGLGGISATTLATQNVVASSVTSLTTELHFYKTGTSTDSSVQGMINSSATLKKSGSDYYLTFKLTKMAPYLKKMTVSNSTKTTTTTATITANDDTEGTGTVTVKLPDTSGKYTATFSVSVPMIGYTEVQSADMTLDMSNLSSLVDENSSSASSTSSSSTASSTSSSSSASSTSSSTSSTSSSSKAVSTTTSAATNVKKTSKKTTKKTSATKQLALSIKRLDNVKQKSMAANFFAKKVSVTTKKNKVYLTFTTRNKAMKYLKTIWVNGKKPVKVTKKSGSNAVYVFAVSKKVYAAGGAKMTFKYVIATGMKPSVESAWVIWSKKFTVKKAKAAAKASTKKTTKKSSKKKSAKKSTKKSSKKSSKKSTKKHSKKSSKKSTKKHSKKSSHKSHK